MNKVLSIAVMALAFSTVAIADEDIGLNVGEQAPCADVQLIKADGTEAKGCVAVPEKAQQKFAVVNFMSIYCGPCNEELPEVAQLVKEISSVASFTSVSTQRKKYETEVRTWLQDNKSKGLINYTMALDSDHVVTGQFKIKYTPTLFILDSNRKVIFSHVGSLSADDIPKIKKVLGL